MKKVSIQELKQKLSAVVSEAAAGVHVIITRHRKAVAQLTSAELEHLHLGARFGEGELRPLLKGGTKGRYLALLADDRRGRGDR